MAKIETLKEWGEIPLSALGKNNQVLPWIDNRRVYIADDKKQVSNPALPTLDKTNMGITVKFYKDNLEWFIQLCQKQYKELREKYTDKQIVKMTGGNKVKYLYDRKTEQNKQL